MDGEVEEFINIKKDHYNYKNIKILKKHDVFN